jgi:hypothetical protein
VLGQLPTVIESLTGVKLEHLLERLPALRGASADGGPEKSKPTHADAEIERGG